MWIARHFRLSRAYAELEKSAVDRAAELQELSHRLLRVQDEERRRLSRDLHDTTGQTLAALKIAVAQLQDTYKEMSAALAVVSEVEQLADQAIGEIRTMSYLLHPPLLDDVGFASAAECYIEGFAKRSGISVQADIAKSRERLPRNVEIALFRVLQESLTNVHRHSGASDASIHFQHAGDAVILEIRDFGKGIPEERLRLLHGVNKETGVGLAGMRERLHELNGKLDIESDGRGTNMRATVPLASRNPSVPLETPGIACASARCLENVDTERPQAGISV